MAPATVTERAWDRIRRYFRDQDWDAAPVPEGQGLNWAYRGGNGEWYGQIWWFDVTEQLLVYSICPLPIPAPARAAAAELAHLINAELAVGCVEVDVATGQVRLRTGVPIGDGDLTDAVIDRVVRTNVATMDRYLPALVRVAAGVAPGRALPVG